MSEPTSEQRSTKIRRLNDDLDCTTTRTEGVEDAGDPNLPSEKSDDTKDTKNEKNLTDENDETIDAKTFIFRSPATQDEIKKITGKMGSQIDFAHDALTKGGYDAYRRMKQNRYKVLSADEDILSGDIDDEDDGMDTDDERKEAQKNNERLAMLEEAVVKGSPRRYQGMHEPH